jgi:hypothetical protein
MADERIVKLILQFIADKGGIVQASQSLDDISKKSDKTKQNAQGIGVGFDGAAKSIKSLSSTIGDLQRVGLTMGAMGTAITGPMIAAANSYISAVNVTTTVGKQWLGATYQLDESWQKVGGVVAGIVVPALQEAANLTEKIANFIQKNPAVAKAMLATGVGLTVGGAAIGGAATVAAGAATIAGGAATLGTAATAAGMTGVAATAATGGTVAGVVGLAALATIPIVMAAITGGASGYVSGKLFSAADKWMRQNGLPSPGAAIGGAAEKLGETFLPNLTKLINKGQQQSVTAAPTEDSAHAEMSATLKQYGMAYLQYVIQEQQAAQQYHLSISRETRDFYRQQTYAQEDYQKQITRSVRDYQLNLSQNEMMFQRSRSLAARDYYISVSRSEQDFNKSQTRAKQDHQWSLFQIIRSGDAMAYFQEMRGYNLSKDRATEDFDISRTRAAEDFARTQNDNAVNYDIQRAFAAKQFAIQMSDAAVDFGIQRSRSQQQFAIQLADQAVDWQIQENQRQTAFNLQLVNMTGDVQKVGYLWSTLTTYMQTDLTNRINSLGAGSLQLIPTPVVPKFAAGGYTPGGHILSHPGEFILRADVAKYGESLAGKRLDQDTMLFLMKNGTKGGSGKTLEYHDGRVFSRGLSSEDRRSIKQNTDDVLAEAFA